MAKKSDLQKVGFNQTASASSTGIAPLHGSHAALPITCDASNARIMAVGEYHYTDIWGAVGLIRDDRKAGETPSENYQRSIADLGTSAATIHISV